MAPQVSEHVLADRAPWHLLVYPPQLPGLGCAFHAAGIGALLGLVLVALILIFPAPRKACSSPAVSEDTAVTANSQQPLSPTAAAAAEEEPNLEDGVLDGPGSRGDGGQNPRAGLQR